MIEYLNKLNLPFHIVLTKIDKLKNGQIIEVSKSFEENFQSFYLLSNKDIRLVTTLAKKIDKLISSTSKRTRLTTKYFSQKINFESIDYILTPLPNDSYAL